MPVADVIALLAFSLGCASFGLTLHIAIDQNKIREQLKQNKKSRGQDGLLALNSSFMLLKSYFKSLNYDLAEDQHKHSSEEIKKRIENIKHYLLMYNSDLDFGLIVEIDLAITDIENWLNNPVYDNYTSRLSSQHIFPTHENIMHLITELDCEIYDQLFSLSNEKARQLLASKKNILIEHSSSSPSPI